MCLKFVRNSYRILKFVISVDVQTNLQRLNFFFQREEIQRNENFKLDYCSSWQTSLYKREFGALPVCVWIDRLIFYLKKKFYPRMNFIRMIRNSFLSLAQLCIPATLNLSFSLFRKNLTFADFVGESIVTAPVLVALSEKFFSTLKMTEKLFSKRTSGKARVLHYGYFEKSTNEWVFGKFLKTEPSRNRHEGVIFLWILNKRTVLKITVAKLWLFCCEHYLR